MNPMHTFHAILAFSLVCSGGCKRKESQTDGFGTVKSIVVRQDTAGLTEKIRMPVGHSRVRWIELPRGIVSRVPGPTDTKLYVMVEVSDSAWPTWEAALGEPRPSRPIYLSPEVAEALLDPELLVNCLSDSKGRRIEGDQYVPTKLETSWYLGHVAVRTGNHVLLEFISR
jgi:hypothetical protein